MTENAMNKVFGKFGMRIDSLSGGKLDRNVDAGTWKRFAFLQPIRFALCELLAERIQSFCL
jgi:hypothetical protein